MPNTPDNDLSRSRPAVTVAGAAAASATHRASTGPEGDAGLARGLSPRHMQMMSVGMAIGVGLFLGSGRGIHIAGPALLIAYALAGAVVYCLMRGLGEMAVHSPHAGSFSEYARIHVSPFAGFVTGWTYWLQCIVGPMAELTASGVYMHYWYPDLPQWVPALIGLILLFGVHWVSVRMFGESEFWFALIKIIAIVGLILFGAVIIITGVTALGHGANLSNLWTSGGFFPNGGHGFFLTLQIAVFAFIGVEMLGITAGEAAHPERTIPKAVGNVIWRIIVFYIGALFILMVVQPWTRYTADVSPFVSVFSRAGLAGAAGIMNFVVLTSALSSCNANMFSASRLLYGLASAGSAPRALHHTTRRRVPGRALTVTTLAVGAGVLFNYLAPAHAFIMLTSVVSASGLWTWSMIAFSHMRFRRRLALEGAPLPVFRLPGAPWTNIFVVAMVVIVLVSLAFESDTRVGLYTGAVWFALLTIIYVVRQRVARVW
ncbi:amino acid permease [Streptomyces violaceusniger]